MITHIGMAGLNTGHSCIMRIYLDGSDVPSAEVPLSAFFGNAYDETVVDCNGKYITLNSALLMLAADRSYNCYFEMPFHKNCQITVENRSADRALLFYAVSGWYGELPSDAGYFHAAYRQEHPVRKGVAYQALETNGKGRFPGLVLSAGMNGHNTCWVEGEVKMYLDNETYPSLNYTGTEDFFCGSFGFTRARSTAINRTTAYNAGLYCISGNDQNAQYNGQQRFSLYRRHLKDAVYFDSHFRMTLDNLGWTGPRYDDYTTVAYYYLSQPATLPYPPPCHADLTMR